MSLEREASFLTKVILSEGEKLELVAIDAIKTPELRAIYKSIARLKRDKNHIDLASVGDNLDDKVGFVYLAEMCRNAHTSSDVEVYAELINKEHYLLKAKKKLLDLSESIEPHKSHCLSELSKSISKVVNDVELISSFNSKKELSIGSSGFDVQVDWLIKDHIPESSFGYIYGASGSYKSFCLIDMVCCVASGLNWFDYQVKRGAVLYIAAEGASGVRRRIKAWEIRHKTKIDNLAVLSTPIIIDDKDGQIELLATIDALKEKTGQEVVAICIDTLARCYSGSENDNSEMNKFIQACDSIKEACGASVIAVHHSGKDIEKGARGASSLRAAADFEFRVTRPKETKNKFQLECTKQKDADEVELKEFDLSVVELGIKDKDTGKPITNMVLNSANSNPITNAHADLLSMQKEGQRKGRGAKHADNLLAIIKDSKQRGQAFNIKHVQDRFYAQNPDLNPNGRRVIYSRAIENLIATGELVKIGNDGLYMLPPDDFNAMENF